MRLLLVEDDRMIGDSLRGARITHPVDGVAFETQCAAQAVADHAVVFHQQQSHRWVVGSEEQG